MTASYVFRSKLFSVFSVAKAFKANIGVTAQAAQTRR